MKPKFTVGEPSRIPPSFCPFCFTMLDAVTSFQDKKVPEPGDFTVCINCGEVLLFDDAMALQPSSLMEIPMHSRMNFATMVQTIKGRGRRYGS